MTGQAESNGHTMISFGDAPDDAVSPAVASTMLRRLLERDDVLFTVLLGEAMTGVRLAKTRARTAAEAPELAAP